MLRKTVHLNVVKRFTFILRQNPTSVHIIGLGTACPTHTLTLCTYLEHLHISLQITCTNDVYYYILDVTGYVIYVSPTEHSKSGNKYFDVNLKTSLDEYTSVRVMMNSNSEVTQDIFHAKKANSMPVTLTKITTVQSGTKFYNSYRGSKVIDAPCAVDFKMDETTHVFIKDLKGKDNGEFIVIGCIRWISHTHETPATDNRPSKLLRECILMDKTDHSCLTVWQKHIEKLPGHTWYRITDVSIKHYFGIKLTTTPSTTVEQSRVKIL